MNWTLRLALGAALLSPAPALAAGEIRTERVHFARGARSATIEGSIQGYETVDYVPGARKGKGQAMNGDAKVAGTNYHATGEVPCSMGGGQPTRSCPFGVERQGGGSGVVTITKPDGRTRRIFFEKGRAITADVSQADPGEFSASKESDLNVIRIGAERYEIPDAVISGG